MRADIVSQALQKYRGSIERNSWESFIQALRSAPDSCADEFMKMRPKSKVLTTFISLFGGLLGLDRIYLGDIKGGIAKLILNAISATLCIIPFIVFAAAGAMGVSGVLLFIGFIGAIIGGALYLTDLFSLRKKAKDVNYKHLAGFLHDKTGEAKVAGVEIDIPKNKFV